MYALYPIHPTQLSLWMADGGPSKHKYKQAWIMQLEFQVPTPLNALYGYNFKKYRYANEARIADPISCIIMQPIVIVQSALESWSASGHPGVTAPCISIAVPHSPASYSRSCYLKQHHIAQYTVVDPSTLNKSVRFKTKGKAYRIYECVYKCVPDKLQIPRVAMTTHNHMVLLESSCSRKVHSMRR